MNDHSSLDIPCEGCNVPAGTRCPGFMTACRQRINHATKLTRDANRKLRESR